MSITPDKLICIGCNRAPEQIPEYCEMAAESPEFFRNAADVVMREEGTLNPENGHFMCTDCYIKAGSPSSPRGWIAP